MCESKEIEKQQKPMETKSVVNRSFYAFARPVLGGLFAVFLPSKVTGREMIPQDGPFLLCANHVSAMDPLMLALKTPKRHLRFIAKAELFQIPVVSWVIRALGAFPIHRGQRDMAAMRESLNLLKDGHAVGIFPQGTRSPVEQRLKMENGVALIALRAKVPVIPAFIGGKFRLFRKTRVAFGKPVFLEDLWGKFDADSMNEATKRIEDAVWALE